MSPDTGHRSVRPGKAKRALIGFNTVLSRLEVILATGCAIVFVSITLMETVGRYFFGYSSQWAAEVATLLFIWSVFLGAAVCFRSNSHLSVDLFTLPAGGRADRFHRLVLFAINAVFVASFCYYGYFLLLSGFNRSTAILGIPLFYGWLAPWVMAVSATFFIIEDYVAPGHISDDVKPPGGM